MVEVNSGRNCGIVSGVGGHTEFCSTRVCLELRLGNILEMVVGDCVPLHHPLSNFISIQNSVHQLSLDIRLGFSLGDMLQDTLASSLSSICLYLFGYHCYCVCPLFHFLLLILVYNSRHILAEALSYSFRTSC